MAKEEWRIQVATAREQAYDWMMGIQSRLKAIGKPIPVDFGPVRFEPIGSKARAAFDAWGSSSGFPWEEVEVWKRKHPRSFHVALWYDATLCGLCFANPTRSKLIIKSILLEGNPDMSHPLKGNVAVLMMLAVNQYAKLLNSI